MRAERAQRDPNAALNCGYSRALAAFDDRPARASGASAIMNASIAISWHRARTPVGNGRNRGS